MFNLLGNQKKQSAYIATEYILTDGPFILQNFNRVNLLGKYSAVLMIIVSFHYALAFQVPGTHLDKYHNDWWIMELFPDLDQLTIQKEGLPQNKP
jgi:hypothetical protein